MMPKITVLVAVRNCEKFLPGCLDSLISQTVIDDIEIIVIDGDSSQDEKSIVASYRRRTPNIKYIYTNKLGIYTAWNIGIRNSCGAYIANLNADDRLAKKALESMSVVLDADSSAALVYGDSYVTYRPYESFEQNSSHGFYTRWPDYSHKQLLVECIIGPHPMWRRSLHDELGYFTESYQIAGDYEFWLRIAEKHKIVHTPNIIGLYYHNRRSCSMSFPIILQQEVMTIKRKYFDSNPP